MDKTETVYAIRARVFQIVTDVASDPDNIFDVIGGGIEDTDTEMLANWVRENATPEELTEIDEKFGGIDEFVSANMLSAVQTTLPDINDKTDVITEAVIDELDLVSDENVDDLMRDGDIDTVVDTGYVQPRALSYIMGAINNGTITLGVDVNFPLREYMDA